MLVRFDVRSTRNGQPAKSMEVNFFSIDTVEGSLWFDHELHRFSSLYLGRRRMFRLGRSTKSPSRTD